MNGNWWRSEAELDVSQRTIVMRPVGDSFAITGPPGSGKTNLLVLRANFTAGSGSNNILLLTYTNALAKFLKSGLSATSAIKSEQIQTFHSWANRHVYDYVGEKILDDRVNFDDKVRAQLVGKLEAANEIIGSSKLYDAIFVDEIQDLSKRELAALLVLGRRVCICGDVRQGIYSKDGVLIVEELGLEKHNLINHYRIGHEVAKIADFLMPPGEGEQSLLATASYNVETQGASNATLVECESVDKQFSEMLLRIRVQLDAYPDERIGVFCCRNETAMDLKNCFESTDLTSLVAVHGVDDESVFSDSVRICVLTIHSAKGAEFKAVHIFGAEQLSSYPFNRTKLAYTAVTRAKTSLTVYSSGSMSAAMNSAFAKPKDIALSDLFDEAKP